MHLFYDVNFYSWMKIERKINKLTNSYWWECFQWINVIYKYRTVTNCNCSLLLKLLNKASSLNWLWSFLLLLWSSFDVNENPIIRNRKLFICRLVDNCLIFHLSSISSTNFESEGNCGQFVFGKFLIFNSHKINFSVKYYNIFQANFFTKSHI